MNTVQVEISLEERAALRNLTKLKKEIETFGTKSDRSFKRSTKAYDIFAGTLSAGLAFKALSSLQQVLSEVVREEILFDKALAEVNTLLPKSEKLTSEMTQSLRDLSVQFGSTPAEQAKAYYQIISSGTTDASKAVNLLNDANTLALGGVADLGGSINLLTDIINVYGEATVNSRDAIDSLFQTVKLGKTNIPQLSASMAQVLPLAKEMEIGLDAVGAALATMTAQGLTTSERTTQLRALFSAVSKNGSLLGESLNSTALRAKGLSQWLQDLRIKTKGNNDELFKLLGRQEAVQAVLALSANDFQNYNNTLAQYENKTGAAAEAAQEMKGTIDFQWKQAQSNLLNLAGGFGLVKSASIEVLKIWNKLFDFGEAKNLDEVNSRLAASRSALKQLNKQYEELSSLERFQQGDDIKFRIKLMEDEIRMYEHKQKVMSRNDELGNLFNAVPDQGGGSVIDPRVEKERKIQEAITEIQENAELLRAEKAIEKKILDNEATESDFEELRLIEQAKIDIEFEAKERKAKLIEDGDKRELELRKLQAQKVAKLEQAIAKADLEAYRRVSSEKVRIEEATSRNRMSLARATGDALLAISGDNKVAALAMEKGFALADIYLQDARARAGAVAATAPLPYPTNLAALGQLQAMITKNTAFATATVAAQTVASIARFETGGVVGEGSLTGDKSLIRVNKKERVLTDRQNQAFEELVYNQAGRAGNDSDVAEAIDNLADAIRNRKTVVSIDGEDIVATIQEKVADGVEL